MSQYTKVSSELSPRPLGGLEAFFKLLADAGKPLLREHWTVHMALRLAFKQSIDDPIPYLRRAWQVLQCQHPMMTSFISRNDSGESAQRPYLSVGISDPDFLPGATFHVCNDCESAVDLFSSLRPTVHATCHWIPASSELVIRSSHWRIDGVGMALLGHEFMTTLALAMQQGHDAPLEELFVDHGSVPSIAPSLEALARTQTKLPFLEEGEENPMLEAGADALMSEFLRGVPSIGLPTRLGSAESIPGNSGCAMAFLDASTTSKVAASCRGKGIKVTSAVHAAIVCATAGFPQHPLSRAYAAFVPIDLRKALDATATPETKAISKVVGLYFSGLPVCVESVVSENGKVVKDFDSIARDLAAVYGRDLLQFWDPGNGSDRKISMLDLAEPYLRRTTALFSSPTPEGFPPIQTPDLSSLGKVEGYIQREYGFIDGETVEVADFWVGTEILNRCVQFHVWSWKGELHLGACFNAEFYEKTFVADVLDKVMQELLGGCGIEKE